MIFCISLILLAGAPETPGPGEEIHGPGELPVKSYEQSNANAGATPFDDAAMFDAFGGQEGVARIVGDLVELSLADPRIGDIFRGQDLVRLRRTLGEQFCYILGGDCTYTGRDMKAAHDRMGIERADMNALVENLQAAMTAEGVPFRLQNRFLSKLAPMRRHVVER
ncbi:MAG: group 1 truncated hemoglobin [Pacificimonas sp.]